MVDSFSSIDTGRDTSLSSGFLDFTEEEKKRMEQLGYDLQRVESAINSGEVTKDDMIVGMTAEEDQLAEQAEREVQREEAGMPAPPNRFMPATVDYQDAPQQQKGFSWDNFFSTNTGVGDFLSSTAGDTGEFFGTVVGFGIEALGRATNNEDIYLAGKKLKEYTVDKSRALKDWGMDEGAKADALGPRSIFTYDKPDDTMPSGLGNFNIGTITQLFGSTLASAGGILLPAKLITKKLIKKGMSPKLASGVGIGVSAGTTEGTMAASSAYDNAIQFARENPELVKNSPIYNDVRKEIIAKFPNASEEDLFTFITDEIAESAALWAGVPAGTVTGVSSGLMLGPFLNRMGFLGKGKKQFDGVRKPLIPALYGGAWREGGEEAFQEGQTQLWANFSEYLSGKSPDRLSGKGVAEAVAVGGLGGGMAGPVFGAVGNYRMPTQEELDNQRTAIMYEWMNKEDVLPQPSEPSPDAPEEAPQVKSPFTTKGSKEYLGDSLDALGLEFDEGQSFKDVAARNNIDIDRLKKIKADIAESEAKQKAVDEQEVDEFSDEGQKQKFEDKGTPTTEQKIEDSVSTISEMLDVAKSEGSSPEDYTFGQFAQAVISMEKQINNVDIDVKEFFKEIKGQRISIIKNDGSSTVGDIVRATHAKHPEFKLNEKFPEFFDKEVSDQGPRESAQPKTQEKKKIKVGEKGTFFLPDGTPIELEVTAVSEAGSIKVRNEKGEEEIVGNRLSTKSAASSDYQSEIFDNRTVSSFSNEELDAVIKRAEEIVAANKGEDRYPSMIRELNALKLERKRRKSKAKPKAKVGKPLSKARIKRLKDINVRLAGRIKEEEEKKKPNDNLISEYNRQIKVNKGFLERGTEEVLEETEAKKETKQVDKKVETKAEKEKPKPTQKAIKEASDIVDEFGTVEEILKRTPRARAVTVEILKQKLIGLKYGVGVVRGWNKERLAKELWREVGKLRGERPDLIQSASLQFIRSIARASAELRNTNAEEILITSGSNALLTGQAFEKIKLKYQKEIDRIRGLEKEKKASPQLIEFKERWEQALRDVSGKAGFAEITYKNRKTGEVRVDHKVVWYGSPEDVKMRRTAQRLALQKIRSITNTKWDLSNLFQALQHKDSKVQMLAKQLLSYENANSEMRLKLFAPYTGQKIIESVFDGHSSLSSPSRDLSRVDMEIMYTRIMNTIDRIEKGSGRTSMKWVLPDEQFDLFVGQKGEGKFIEVPLELTLDEKNEIDTLRAEAASLSDTIFNWFGERPKQIPYTFYRPDDFYFREFEKISKRFFGDGKNRKGLIGRQKENVSKFIKDKKDKFEKYKQTQLSKASSTKDKMDKKEAEKLIAIEEGNVAKSIADHMDSVLPVIIDGYDNYYAGLRENGFNIENLRPVLFEDFTEQEVKEENKKIAAAKAGFTSKLNNLFEGKWYIGRAGLYSKTGWTATPEEKDIYSALMNQQLLEGSGDEILTVADFTAINDHYHFINTTGHGGKMDLARLKNLGYNSKKYDPTQDERGGGWKTVLRKKPATEVLWETTNMSEAELENLLETELKPEIDRVGKVLADIYREARKRGKPLVKMTRVEDDAGVEGKTLIGWDKGKGIWRPTKGSPVKKKTVIVPVTKKMKSRDGKDSVVYEKKRAREWIPETRTVTKKVWRSNRADDFYWQEMEVYTGKADESAPLAFVREYEIIYNGKKEFRRLDNMPPDIYVKDIYFEKIDDKLQKKIDAIISDSSLHRDERSAKLNKLLVGRKEITEIEAKKTVQVVDKEETKKRGTTVYKEEETGIAIPFNSFRRTYEKVLNKRKAMKNAKGKDAHDNTGKKMYHEDWNYRDAKDNNGEPIPRFDIVWEEVEEWDGEPEHPFLKRKELNEEQKSLGRFKESKRWVASQNSGWYAVNAYGKTVIPVKGVSKLIMDQINPPKPEMSEAQADAHVRQFVKKNRDDGKDHFNRTRTSMILDTLAEDGEAIKDIVRRRSTADGRVLDEFIKTINPADGSVMLRKIKTGLTQAVEDSKITSHPQTGRNMKIYNLTYSREGKYQGDLIYRDDPLQHISFETRTVTGVKSIKVIAEDGTTEGRLLGTIVLVRNEQGVEEISSSTFEGESLRESGATKEQIDKLMGHVLGVYVAKQPKHYTGVDPYAVGLGVKPHMSEEKKSLIKEMESKPPPTGERFLGYVSTAKGMNESARNAFSTALNIESEASKLEQMSTFSTINPDTGEAYETGGRWFTGEFGMEEIVPETEAQRRNRIEKKYKPMLKPMLLALKWKGKKKKVQSFSKWAEQNLVSDEATEEEQELAEKAKRRQKGEFVSREGEISFTGEEIGLTPEEQEAADKVKETMTKEQQAEMQWFLDRAAELEEMLEGVKSSEKSGEPLTKQQEFLKDTFASVIGSKTVMEYLSSNPEKALEMITEVMTGISMNQGKQDDINLAEVSSDSTGDGIQKEIEEEKDEGSICRGGRG